MNTLNRGCGGGGWGGEAYTYNFPSFHFDLFYTSPKIWGMEEGGGGLIIIQFSICRFEKEKVCRGTHPPPRQEPEK